MDRIALNPFYVLAMPITASRTEIEREGLKLLGMLELGLADARTYPTPCGPMERTADRVREALAELRIPEKRLMHELWAQGAAPTAWPTTDEGPAPVAEATPPPDPWIAARRAMGFGRG